MSPRFIRHALFSAVLLFSGLLCQAGLTSYTDRGKTDFDTVLPLLNPYGTWSKLDGVWAYTPLNHVAPYTDGRWIYTEYGWYWKGHQPHSWVTEHYGYWKRSADKVWSWYPGPYWLPQIVEIRATATHVGWRSAEVDDSGNFVEKPADRYAKTDEWTFVTIAQFAGMITPALVAKPDVAQAMLEDSTDCRHTYLTYREIDRVGPHPADFTKFGDGGMYAPKTEEEVPVIPPSLMKAATNAPTDTSLPESIAPALDKPDVDPHADPRQVKYWVTMSLPNYWAKPPDDAKPQEIYLYRPDFYQDEDGIERRITLWFNPETRTKLNEVLAGSSLTEKSQANVANGGPSTSGLPATAASDPFRSPLDDSYHPGSNADRTPSPSSKNPSPPSGTNSTKAPIPLPFATNAPPVNPH